MVKSQWRTFQVRASNTDFHNLRSALSIGEAPAMLKHIFTPKCSKGSRVICGSEFFCGYFEQLALILVVL